MSSSARCNSPPHTSHTTASASPTAKPAMASSSSKLAKTTQPNKRVFDLKIWQNELAATPARLVECARVAKENLPSLQANKKTDRDKVVLILFENHRKWFSPLQKNKPKGWKNEERIPIPYYLLCIANFLNEIHAGTLEDVLAANWSTLDMNSHNARKHPWFVESTCMANLISAISLTSRSCW